MSNPTNGWGDSTVATSYICSRLYDILDARFAPEKDMAQELSNLYSELAHNFTVDTGLKVGPFIHGLDGGEDTGN